MTHVLSLNHLCAQMRSEGTILFKVVPNTSQLSSINKPVRNLQQTCSGIFILEMHAEYVLLLCEVYMRAMVDYCPLQDSSIPCPDVGVFFSKGEVLEVLDQTDGQWWQARKITSSASFPGLIPSAATLKR